MIKPNWGGKIALVTGASSGIGEASAYYLAVKGIRVILTARREGRLETIRQNIINNGGQAEVFPADLSQESDRIRLYEALKSSALLPDILINNAGMAWYGYFNTMPWSIARDTIRVNIEGVTHLSLLFLPHMVENHFGRIINIGSIAGKLPEQGISVYSASKAFIDAISKSMYRDLHGSGVIVSVIRSGPVKTEFFDTARERENGRSIPAEAFSIEPIRVARKVWMILQHPVRFAYVPAWLTLSPLLEVFFSGIIDMVGPVLLRNKKN
jgi:short-subunit dehydrogenase